MPSCSAKGLQMADRMCQKRSWPAYQYAKRGLKAAMALPRAAVASATPVWLRTALVEAGGSVFVP